ncbi:MAG: hypothetical protein KAH54_09085 [Candidatus Sabulitectum sp.]|nr:hypothetical protein [Candidatus Sabulitectum sp.]
MSEKHCCFIAVLVLLITVVVCFYSTLRAGFVSDDYFLINRVASEGFYSGWGGNGSVFFRPATTLTFLFDHSIWGTSSAGFHLTNLFWHLFAGIGLFLLYFLVMKQLPIIKPCLYATLSSVLFLVLASHSESVAWVSGRTDIIATVLCIASLYFFYRQLNKKSILFSTLALLLFPIGLLAKESVIITPLLWGLFLAYSSPSRGENLRRNLTLIGFSTLIAVAYFSFRIILGDGLVSGIRYGGFLDLSPAGFAENLVRYTLRVLLPPFPPGLRGVVTENPIIVLLFFVLLVLPVSILVYRRAEQKKKNLLFLMTGCFFASLLPVLGMKVSLFDTQSERFLYLPGVFASGFFTVAMISLFKESKLALILLICVIFLQGIFLHRSNENWAHAGRLCSTIAQSVSEHDADSVYILAIPDSYRGAYVFRNGLNEAVAMLKGGEPDYIVLYKISSYGDSLISENVNLIDLDETERTVITCVDGRMQSI